MELLDFINNNPNWEEILKSSPYYLTIKHQSPYILFEYNQFISDMRLPICQQARGFIVRQNDSGKWIAISRGMDKFFNAQQSEAAPIDWSSAIVSAKIDGSNIRLAYDHIADKWLVSTTGTADAANAETSIGHSFKYEFIRILGGTSKFLEFCNNLTKQYTYYFELVSNYNKIVVKYEDEAIYYIGRRDMITFHERPMSDMPKVMEEYGIRRIPTFPLHSMSECIAAAEALGENAEGYVVTDTFFNRNKIKTPWYIAMHRMRGNGILTCRRVCEMWRADILDDYAGNFPEYQPYIEKVVGKIKEVASNCELSWNIASTFEGGRKEIALSINKWFTSMDASYIFARLDGKVQNGIDWMKKMPTRKLGDYIESLLDIKEFGMEDEV